ncbi:MAG: alpha/beta fold hydrolase [Ornithinimicrobium sp.]
MSNAAPAPPRLRAFEHEGLTFAVSDTGPIDGPVVVLLHGFPQDRSTWNAVVPHLSAAGLRSLALEQRGYGPDNAPVEARRYGVEALASDVLAMLDAAELEAAHLVGHDWGAAVAWHLAGTGDRILSLISLSTPHPAALVRSFFRSTQAFSSYYMLAFQAPLLPERLLARRLRGLYRSTGLSSNDADRYAERFRDPATLTGPVNWYRAMVRQRSRTPRSRVPTTYVWGRQDFALGAVAARGTADFVRADYRFLEIEAGHWLPETAPEIVAEEVVRRVVGR